MSLRFVNGSSMSCTKDVAPVTTLPLTMACWFRPDAINSRYTLMSLGDLDTASNVWILRADGTGGNKEVGVAIINSDPAGEQTLHGTSYVGNVWSHACGLFISDSSRTIYFNGIDPVSTTNTFALNATPDRIAIGVIASSSPTNFMDGVIAECGLWDVELDPQEILALANGINPSRIRPLSLKGYWPLWDTTCRDLTNQQNTLTPNNTPTRVTGPPVELFTRLHGDTPFLEFLAPAVGAHNMMLLGVGR